MGERKSITRTIYDNLPYLGARGLGIFGVTMLLWSGHELKGIFLIFGACHFFLWEIANNTAKSRVTVVVHQAEQEIGPIHDPLRIDLAADGGLTVSKKGPTP